MPLTAANPEATLASSDGDHHDEEAGAQCSLTHDSAGVLGKRLFPQQEKHEETTDATSSGKLSVLLSSWIRGNFPLIV